MEFILIPIMAILSRASGSDGRFGTLWTGWSGLPELLYGAVFGCCCYAVTNNYWLSLALAIISWRGMELGHGTFYNMKGWQGIEMGTQIKPRMQELDYPLLFLFSLFHADPQKPIYSWIAMGIKGLLIGCPLLAFAPLQSVLFVFAYAVNRRYFAGRPELAEWTAGAGAGVTCALAIYFAH